MIIGNITQLQKSPLAALPGCFLPSDLGGGVDWSDEFGHRCSLEQGAESLLWNRP